MSSILLLLSLVGVAIHSSDSSAVRVVKKGPRKLTSSSNESLFSLSNKLHSHQIQDPPLQLDRLKATITKTSKFRRPSTGSNSTSNTQLRMKIRVAIAKVLGVIEEEAEQ